MRPLVYDFGQLNQSTERDYIGQIVEDHVSRKYSLNFSVILSFYVQMKEHLLLQQSLQYSKVIADTFKTAQAYMRARNVRIGLQLKHCQQYIIYIHC